MCKQINGVDVNDIRLEVRLSNRTPALEYTLKPPAASKARKGVAGIRTFVFFSAPTSALFIMLTCFFILIAKKMHQENGRRVSLLVFLYSTRKGSVAVKSLTFASLLL